MCRVDANRLSSRLDDALGAPTLGRYRPGTGGGGPGRPDRSRPATDGYSALSDPGEPAGRGGRPRPGRSAARNNSYATKKKGRCRRHRSPADGGGRDRPRIVPDPQPAPRNAAEGAGHRRRGVRTRGPPTSLQRPASSQRSMPATPRSSTWAGAGACSTVISGSRWPVRDQGCVFAGCERPPAWCEAHHARPWSTGGPTDIDNGCLLCCFHHHLVHAGEWTVLMAPDGIAGDRPTGTDRPEATTDPTRTPQTQSRLTHHAPSPMRSSRHLAGRLAR